MNQEQIAAFEQHQNSHHFHPFTCGGDGDAAHIAYEFERRYPGQDYRTWLESERANGVRFPGAHLTETNLIATPDGLKCPVCDYRQNFGGFEAGMVESASRILEMEAALTP